MRWPRSCSPRRSSRWASRSSSSVAPTGSQRFDRSRKGLRTERSEAQVPGDARRATADHDERRVRDAPRGGLDVDLGVGGGDLADAVGQLRSELLSRRGDEEMLPAAVMLDALLREL